MRNWTSSKQEQVGAAVAFPEVVGSSLAYGPYIGVGEFLGGGVDKRHTLGSGAVADGVHEMGLAKPDVRVQDEGVVEFAGPAGDRGGRGVRELVGLPYDEALEDVLGVEGSGPVHRRLGLDLRGRNSACLIVSAVH